MSWLGLLQSKRFVGIYSIITVIVLSSSLIFNILGFLGSPIVQGFAGVLTVIGMILLWGQILLSLSMTNRRDRVGWILVRFAYIALFVVILGFISVAGSSFLSSFYLLGNDSPHAALFLSTIGYAIPTSFGICFSAVSYHTLAIEKVWLVE